MADEPDVRLLVGDSRVMVGMRRLLHMLTSSTLLMRGRLCRGLGIPEDVLYYMTQ